MPTNPSLTPTPKPSLIDNFKEQYQNFVILIKKNPQLISFVSKFQIIWIKYGFRIKLISAFLVIVFLILIAIRLGTNFANQSRPDALQPPPIADITPPAEIKTETEIEKLRQEIQDFSTLLPDPAPPAVDPDISLNPINSN